MNKVLLVIGGVVCAIGSFIIPSKLQEQMIDDEVEKKLKEREGK